MSILVRDVADADAEQWAGLYAGYRGFYHLPVDPNAVAATWQWIAQGQHGLIGLVAAREADGVLVGLANLRLFARPSFAAMGLYLDDLFTAPDARGQGVASALLRSASRRASAEGADIVRWITASDNDVARRLYDRVASTTHWVTYDMQPS